MRGFRACLTCLLIAACLAGCATGSPKSPPDAPHQSWEDRHKE
ncbi:MAG: hypothetical protein AABZ53_05680 [Planctomycetota bacterium]